VILSGADLSSAADWKDLGDGLFSHPWTEQWGHFTYRWGPPEPLGHRREMVIVDGQPLRQMVLERYDYDGHSYDDRRGAQDIRWQYREFLDPKTTLAPGAFGVAERAANGAALFVKVADPDAFRKATVEIARRRQILVLSDKENLVVRNLTFQHAANDFRNVRREGPLTIGAKARNILIEDCRFLWNNFDGLPIGGSDITLRRVEASYNGFGGFAHGASNLLVEDCVTNFNNWRGHWGGQRSWNMGGFKFGAPDQDRITIRRHTAVGNLCPGVWSDIHPKNVRVEDSVIALNDRIGLFFELSHGPHLAERCLLVHNATSQYTSMVAGITEIRDSVMFGDSVEQAGRHRLQTPVAQLTWYIRQSDHARMGRLEPEVARMTGNVVAGGPRQAMLVQVHNGTRRDDPRYEKWKIDLANNVFSGPTNEAFVYNDRNWGWHIVQLAPFTSQLKLSQNQMADVKFENPQQLDFRVQSDSPVAGRKELPLKQLDAAWISRTRAFFDWAGYDGGPLVVRQFDPRAQRDHSPPQIPADTRLGPPCS
ncbi:MAG TPA: right-handed parallel beta-helix repeat-containing protein, partial [Lacipirellulaceae bacterium]|nr:right-handed parallel beta-helix repeat-containing protein [Lacipirellulaceae bacterium]